MPNEETVSEQIGKLARFITEEIPGEPSQSEGAVDCAIRVMRDQQAACTAYRTALERLVVEALATLEGTDE